MKISMDLAISNIIIIIRATGITVSSLLLNILVMRLKLPGLMMA